MTIKDFDWSKLDGMLMFDASKNLCSRELGVSDETIERRIRDEHDCTFSEYKKKQLEKTVLKLKQKLIQMGLKGNLGALIFALKNLSDWTDKVTQTTEHKIAKLAELVEQQSE